MATPAPTALHVEHATVHCSTRQRSNTGSFTASSVSIPIRLTKVDLSTVGPTGKKEYLNLLFGKANMFKEGDASISIAAIDEEERVLARSILYEMKLKEITFSDFGDDDIGAYSQSAINGNQKKIMEEWTVGDLKKKLLSMKGEDIRTVGTGLSSEQIAAVCKLMSDEELIKVSSKVYNPLPDSTVGSEGYFGSRLQPNSPTDDPLEILFATLEGLSYGCGDVIIGVNPVASDHPSVRAIEEMLQRVWKAFRLEDKTSYVVLAHIDDQIAVDDDKHELIQTLFQSIGGNTDINQTFNVQLPKMLSHLSKGKKQYFETGQGSAVTNGVANGVDMVTLESRAYGLIRAFKKHSGMWTISNDVAGFIGPEVFKTTPQLVRACLEDLFMGKLHGLTMGLDICSTYHMGVPLEDFDFILDEVMKAGPAFYMSVPGRNDPMLSYLTTGFRDHARLRKKHHKKVSDKMAEFFREVGIMQPNGDLTARGGDTAYMYLKMKQGEGDKRGEREILNEAYGIITKLQEKGLDIGFGHNGKYSPLPMQQERLQNIYNNAKLVIYENLVADFETRIRHESPLSITTTATSREEYVLKPISGEILDEKSVNLVKDYAVSEVIEKSKNAIVIFSDGLNPYSLDHPDQVTDYVNSLRKGCAARGISLAKEIVLRLGRVRAGYAVGKLVFGTASTKYVSDEKGKFTIFHVIGERPGNGNNTYSIYISSVTKEQWAEGITHDVVKVVSGVSFTALHPSEAAHSTLDCLDALPAAPAVSSISSTKSTTATKGAKESSSTAPFYMNMNTVLIGAAVVGGIIYHLTRNFAS